MLRTARRLNRPPTPQLGIPNLEIPTLSGLRLVKAVEKTDHRCSFSGNVFKLRGRHIQVSKDDKNIFVCIKKARKHPRGLAARSH